MDLCPRVEFWMGHLSSFGYLSPAVMTRLECLCSALGAQHSSSNLKMALPARFGRTLLMGPCKKLRSREETDCCIVFCKVIKSVYFRSNL